MIVDIANLFMKTGCAKCVPCLYDKKVERPYLEGWHVPVQLLYGSKSPGKIPSLANTFIFNRTSWIKVYGTKYKRGCIVVLSLQHGDPVFGKVNEVMLVDGKHIIFKCTILHNQGFEEHLNAYKVIVDGGNETYVDHSSLLDFHPLDLLKGCGDNANTDFCVLRYRVDYLV